MNKIILSKLREIEEKENVRIIYCVESGSRAWGFASPDSDYDVRFIYIRPEEYYLRLDKTRDVIEWQLDDTLDINGWDVSKVLALLHSSNPTVFEWNASPIIYYSSQTWNEISSIMPDFFSKKALLYHYLSMAKKNFYDFLLGGTVRYKKYFYALRPLLSCKWILEEETPPPILFETLMAKYLDEDIQPEVLELLKIKKRTSEGGAGKPCQKINTYIEQNLIRLAEEIRELPDERRLGWDELNELFCSLVKN